MKTRLLACILAITLYVTGWLCIDWVLNYSTYQGMITDLWLMQIPFTSIEISFSPWQAYYLSMIQITVSVGLFIYAFCPSISRLWKQISAMKNVFHAPSKSAAPRYVFF